MNDPIPTRWRGLVCLAFVYGSALISVGRSATNETPKSARGFSYIHDEVPDGPLSVHIVKIDRSNTELELHTSLAGGTTYGLSTLAEQIKLFPAELGRPVAAINGDFWNDNSDYKGDPKGLQILHEELLSGPCDRTCFWIDRAGNPRMTNVVPKFAVTWPGGEMTPFGLNEERPKDGAVLYTPVLGPSTRTAGGRELILEATGSSPWLPLRVGQTYAARVREIRESGNGPLDRDVMILSLGPQLLSGLPKVNSGVLLKLSISTWPDLAGARTAIGGGPTLVQNGKPMQWSGYQPRHPRTAIGWNEHYLFFLVVDGRQNGLSIGMTFPQLAAYMAKLGCAQAMNLDGGASATCWVLGQVMNSPSAGHQRNMANALILVQKEKK